MEFHGIKRMIKRLWLIWSRTVDHRIGKTDDDAPDIPILKNKDEINAKARAKRQREKQERLQGVGTLVPNMG